jgi:hypothetical protein
MHVARAQLAGLWRLLTVACCVLGGAWSRLERCARDKRHIHHKDAKSTKEKAEVVAEFARVLWGCSCVACGDAGVRSRDAGVICHVAGVICDKSDVIGRAQGVICHLQDVICHVAGAICHLQGVIDDKSDVICHVAGVICDRSRVIGPCVTHRRGNVRPTCQRKGLRPFLRHLHPYRD